VVGQFSRARDLQPTDSFGTRRIFNGKLASIHKGMDFRAQWARRCAPATAAWWCWLSYFITREIASSSTTDLACDALMHLSRIDVKEGQHVAAGNALASAAPPAALPGHICIGRPLAGRLSGPREAAAAELERRALAGDGFFDVMRWDPLPSIRPPSLAAEP